MTICKPKLLQQKKDTTGVVTAENKPESRIGNQEISVLVAHLKA
jgi:hypothetical protein